MEQGIYRLQQLEHQFHHQWKMIGYQVHWIIQNFHHQVQGDHEKQRQLQRYVFHWIKTFFMRVLWISNEMVFHSSDICRVAASLEDHHHHQQRTVLLQQFQIDLDQVLLKADQAVLYHHHWFQRK